LPPGAAAAFLPAPPPSSYCPPPTDTYSRPRIHSSPAEPPPLSAAPWLVTLLPPPLLLPSRGDLRPCRKSPPSAPATRSSITPATSLLSLPLSVWPERVVFKDLAGENLLVGVEWLLEKEERDRKREIGRE
ncbi:unnamed protein product, partial [Linum tenue]